jgi:hypothetical protein
MRGNRTSFSFKIAAKSKWSIRMKKIVSFWIVFLLSIVSAEAAQQQRSFYLTQTLFTGAQALTACAKGYHMASLWEIFDVSNLKYNKTLGFSFTFSHSGSGPAGGIREWIRGRER